MLVAFIFDDRDLAEREQIEQNLQFYRQRTTGVNMEALVHILATESGQRVVAGAARHFEPGQRFSRADLANAIGTQEATVFSWIRQLGRPETRYGITVFQRHDDGTYSLSEAMHAAIMQIRKDSVFDRITQSKDFVAMPKNDRKKVADMTKYAVRLLWERAKVVSDPFSPQRTEAEILEFIARHPKLLKAVKHIWIENGGGENRIRKYLTLGYASGLLYLMGSALTDPNEYWKADSPNETPLDWSLWDKACEFWLRLAGDDSSLQAVRIALGNLDEEGSRAHADRLAIIAKAWNCFRCGHQITEADVALNYDTDAKGFRRLTDCPTVGGIDRWSPEEPDADDA